MLKQIDGNLLGIESGVILHQVNCRGVTGGLAGALRRRWPDHFKTYLAACAEHHPRKLLGQLAASAVEGHPLTIFHVFGQFNPGPNTNLQAVEDALCTAATLHKWLPMFAPYKMGCGLGGGNWEEYSALIERYLKHCIIIKHPQYK